MIVFQPKYEIRIFMIRHKHDKFDGIFYVWKPVSYREVQYKKMEENKKWIHQKS